MWATPGVPIDNHGKKLHYIALLKEAVRQSVEFDQRTPDVFEALDWLEANSPTVWGVKHFRRGLEIEDPRERWQTLVKAFKDIERGV